MAGVISPHRLSVIANTADDIELFGLHVSPDVDTFFGVAQLYQGLIDILVLDRTDESLAEQIESLGMRVIVTDTIMNSLEEKRRWAKSVLDVAGVGDGRGCDLIL